MAINPNELFYRGYNPATLLAGYEDTWALQSWKEISATKTAPMVEEKKEEKTGIAALYSGYYGDNGVKGRKGSVARTPSLQEKKAVVNGTWFLQRRAVARAASLQDRTKEIEGLDKKGIIELRMPLCCEGCVVKVQRKLKSLKGVASVECSQEKQKVIVRGSAAPEEVLKRAKAALPRSSFWVEES